MQVKLAIVGGAVDRKELLLIAFVTVVFAVLVNVCLLIIASNVQVCAQLLPAAQSLSTGQQPTYLGLYTTGPCSGVCSCNRLALVQEAQAFTPANMSSSPDPKPSSSNLLQPAF